MKTVAAGSVRRFAMAAGFVVVLLGIHGSGCRKESPTPAANAPAAGQTSVVSQEAPNPVQEPAVDKAVATVNGVDILESQVKRRVEVKWKPQLNKLAAQSPELAAQQEKIAVRTAMNELVIEQLLEEEAKAAGIDVTPEQLTAEMTEQLGKRTPPTTIDEYKKIVELQGGNFEVMKEFLARNMKYHKLLEAKTAGSVNVTEDDAKKYYDEHLDEFKTPEQVKASHILIETRTKDPNIDASQAKVQARQKIDAILKQVKEGGDFAALAKEHSACPSSAQGGDLGLFGRGSMVPPFEEAAFALKPGEVSNVVETQFGYHIIKLTEHHDPNTVAFDKARDEIMTNMKGAKMQEARRNYIQSLQQKAKITYVSPEMTPVPAAPAGAVKVEPQVQTAPKPAEPVQPPAQPAPPADANQG